MQSIMILLSSERIVQNFVDDLLDLQGDFDLVTGNYILDARSLMGIFSLDLSLPVQLNIHDDSPQNMAAVQKYKYEK